MTDSNQFNILITNKKSVRAPMGLPHKSTSKVVEFSGSTIDNILLGGKENAPQMAHAADDNFVCSLCNRRLSKDVRGGSVESLSGCVDVCEGCYETPTRSTASIGADYARGE